MLLREWALSSAPKAGWENGLHLPRHPKHAFNKQNSTNSRSGYTFKQLSWIHVCDSTNLLFTGEQLFRLNE